MWSSFAAGIKGPIPNKVKSRPQCSDEGSMVVCACIARLNKNNTDMNEFDGLLWENSLSRKLRHYSRTVSGLLVCCAELVTSHEPNHIH